MMLIHRRLVILIILALALVGCTRAVARPRTAAIATFRGDEPDPAETLSKLVKAHNDERKEEKLPALEENELLKKAAQIHADDMAKTRKMDHTGSDGSTPFERMKKAGYRYQRAGENIAKGQRGLDELMKTWMSSEGHKKNILGKFRDIGAAYATDEDGTPYWCVTFGTPIPSDDPPPR